MPKPPVAILQGRHLTPVHAIDHIDKIAQLAAVFHRAEGKLEVKIPQVLENLKGDVTQAERFVQVH